MEAEHITALRGAFPGVWIRADGAFRDDAHGIHWAPGDVESSEEYVRGAFSAPGLCYFGGPPAMGHGPSLKLSQLSALVDYISTVHSRRTDNSSDKEPT